MPLFKLKAGWWGILPSLVTVLVFAGYPLIQVMGFSTLNWGGTDEGKYIGLKNYQNLLTDSAFWESLWITVKFAALTLPAFILFSVFIAIEIENTRFERMVKALLFLPGLLTVAASAISWYTLFSPEYGVFAELFGVSLPWGSEGWAALLLVAMFTVWQHVGYGVLVFSAGLKSISPEIIEAARVDGASEAQIRRQIIIPLLKPSVIFLGVIGSLYALESYTAVFLLTKGGPFGSTSVVGYFLYKTAFEQYKMGYAAAISVVVLALAFTFAVWQTRRLQSNL